MTKPVTRWINALLHRGPGYNQPTQTETHLRDTLTELAARWDQHAATLTAGLPTTLYAEFTAAQERQSARSHAYRRAASDVRYTLRTGHLPHDLMTDAELEQHGKPEGAVR